MKHLLRGREGLRNLAAAPKLFKYTKIYSKIFSLRFVCCYQLFSSTIYFKFHIKKVKLSLTLQILLNINKKI